MNFLYLRKPSKENNLKNREELRRKLILLIVDGSSNSSPSLLHEHPLSGPREGLLGDLLLLAVAQPTAHLEPDCTAKEAQGLLLQW